MSSAGNGTMFSVCLLQVSDVEQIIGLVQAENIQVHAEAYDVALDMSFPKGDNTDLLTHSLSPECLLD